MAKDPCSTEWADSNSTVWHANSRQIFHLSIGNLANCGVWSSTNHHISSVLKGDVLLIGAVDEELCSESRGVTQAINYLTDRWGRRLDMLKQQVGLAQSNPTDSPKHFNAGQALPTAAIPSLEADHQRHCSFCFTKSTRGKETSTFVPLYLYGLTCLWTGQSDLARTTHHHDARSKGTMWRDQLSVFLMTNPTPWSAQHAIGVARNKKKSRQALTCTVRGTVCRKHLGA